MKLKSRMLVLIFFLIATPFLLLGSLFYATSVLRDQRESMEYMIRQSASMIDGALDEVRLLSDMMCINPVVQEYMRTSSASQSKNAQIDEMNTLEMVIAHCYQSDAIYDVRMYFTRSKFYTVEQISFFPMSVFEAEERFFSAGTLGQISDGYLRSYKDKSNAYIATYYRLIKDTIVLNRTIGALCVDINLSQLEQYLALPRGTGIQSITILQPDGTSVLEPGEDVQPFDMSRISQIDESKYRDGMDAVFSVPLSRNGWVLAGRLPNAYALFGGASNAAFWTALALLMALVLCIVLAVLSIFARRVDQLVELLDPRNVVRAAPSDEQQHGFVSTLNHAVVRARELLDYQREQVLLTHKTQLKLLQAQINPHFLYNALDSANWLILDGERERASEMVLAIARYYRFALSKGRDELTVEEDLDLAITYAHIQECRLKGSIQIQSHIQSDAKGALIPKMTIQPVVENCIIHGFQKQLSDARIDIDIYESSGFLYITVCDNGHGMNADKARRIPYQESTTGGFGLQSVHQRCILFSSSEECGITVESEQGMYTMVTIKLAYKRLSAG